MACQRGGYSTLRPGLLWASHLPKCVDLLTEVVHLHAEVSTGLQVNGEHSGRPNGRGAHFELSLEPIACRNSRDILSFAPCVLGLLWVQLAVRS